MSFYRREKTGHFINCIIFLFISAILVLPFIKTGNIFAHSDWGFHAGRVEQIYLNLKRDHLFTYIATDTFNHSGSANFLFYPYVFLYPWALLRFIFNPITAFYLYVMLLFLCTMIIAYFSMYSWSKSKSRAFIFALLYQIVPYHLYLTIGNTVLGEAQAYSFLPLVILGTYFLLEHNQFKMLVCGLTLVGYCHIVSVVISLEAVTAITILWLLLNWPLAKEKFLTICLKYIQAGLITVVLSIGVMTPFFVDYHGLLRPQSMIGFLINFGQFSQNALSNQVVNNGGIGLILFIALFIGWYKACSQYLMMSYILGVFFSILSTNLFPWHFLNNSIFTVVQFPYRYLSLASVFLSIVGTNIIQNVLSKKNEQVQLIPYILTIVVISFTCLGSLVSPLERIQIPTSTAKVLKALPNDAKYYALSGKNDESPKLLNNNNYYNQFDYGITWGETDYWPVQSVAHRNFVFNESRRRRLTPGANKITYYIYSRKKQNRYLLPCVTYKNTTLEVNSKHQAIHTKNGLITAALNRGVNKIVVSFNPPAVFYISWIVSIIAWCLLIFSDYKKNIIH